MEINRKKEAFVQLRRRFGLTQAEMAKRFGITRSYYGEIESGRKRPSETLWNMLDLLDGTLGKPDRGSQSTWTGVAEELGVYASNNPANIAKLRMNLSSEFQPPDHENRIATLEDVVRFLRPWLFAASEDPNLPPYMLKIFKKHLPHSDLEETHEST